MLPLTCRLGALLFATSITLTTASYAAVDLDANVPSQQDLAAMAQVEARTSGLDAPAPQEFNGDVRDLQQTTFTPPRYWHMWNEFEEPARIKPVSAASSPSEIPQPTQALAAMPGTSVEFDGLGFSDVVSGGTAGAGWPPDVNGDVGPTVYIQAVNDAFAIYNKSGQRLAAFTEDNLWGQVSTGTPCNGNNEGDPVVVHDGLADRWVLTNFAFAVDNNNNPIAPFYECMAVSKTNDPVSGGWYFYAVRMDTGGSNAPPVGTLNDYPKFGVWSDCLYMGANGFDSTDPNFSFSGAIFAAFNRNTLYAGQSLNSTNSSVGFLSGASAPFSLFPANILGTLASSQPPSGTPEYFVAESGSAFAWEVRKFQSAPNTCGANSTLGTATNVTHASYGYPEDPTTHAVEIVPQRNTTNTLDSLGDRVMQKVQYRKIGSTESLWVVHTTCGSAQSATGRCVSSTTTTQPQWSQINVSNKTVSTAIVQQQIYTPDTTQYRWMGSLAVDAQGNMALGYSISSGTMFPSIAYSGRLVNDTLGQLPQTETILQAGSGSQVNAQNQGIVQRWGDYSAMSIDPSDDCTFWYTNEYFDTVSNGTNGIWKTRIGAFKFPGCVAVTGTKLVFTQQPNASYVSNATITVKVSIEDANGNVATGDTSAVTLALAGGPGGAVLNGTTTVNAQNGVATFSNLSVAKVGTGYQLNATDGSLTTASSNAFDITVGAATSIAFSTQPNAGSNVTAGNTIPLVAHVQDAAANPVSGQSVTLSIAANPGNSTLAVTTNPVTTDSNGNATFANVALNKAGLNYALKATDNTTPLSVVGNTFNVIAGTPNSLTFTTQPATASNVGATATIPLVAHVADANGNGVPSQSIQLTITSNPGGSTLTAGANPVSTDANGDATFPGVSLNKSGSGYQFQIVDNSQISLTAISNAFNLIAGAPSQLKFLQQPGTGTAGVALNPPVSVQVFDAQNNLVTTDTNTIVLSVFTGPGGFDPSATVSAPLSAGKATFANLVFRVAGAGYQLSAADSVEHLTSAPSNAFTISPGVPRLIFTTEPADLTRGAALGTIAVTEDDGSGNALPDDTSSIDFSIGACGGTVDLGSVTTSNGVATLSSTQSFYTAATGLTISASNGVLTGTSRAFNVTNGINYVFADGFDGCRL